MADDVLDELEEILESVNRPNASQAELLAAVREALEVVAGEIDGDEDDEDYEFEEEEEGEEEEEEQPEKERAWA